MRKITTNAKEVSDEKMSSLRHDAMLVLAETRRAMLTRMPFTGSVAMNLDIVPVRDIRLETAATDGKQIFFDIDFLSSLTADERMFAFGHEVWHVLLMHFARTENRDRLLMNIATDLEVNQLLAKEGFSVWKHAYMPDKIDVPADKCAEEYYEILSKRNQAPKQDSFDKHIYSGDNMLPSDGQDQCVSDKYGKVGIDPNFNPGNPKDNVERTREAVVSAAQVMERQRGSLPGHIKGLVEALLKPEIDWREQLQQFVTRSSCGETRMWNPPNRRHVHNGLYLQSRHGEKIRLGVVIDTSGSVQSMIKKFLSELNGLATQFGNYVLHTVQCDVEVQDYTEYSDDNPLDVENTGFEVTGGGGTILMPGINYFAENDLDVDCIIVFTDTYCEDMPEENAPDVPVLWMSTAKGDHSNIHFGEIVEFNEKQ